MHAARDFEFEVNYPEGSWVGAGEPIVYIRGSLVSLSDLETILLQKLGPACVAAHNAYQMCLALPKVAFLAMDARHCAGAEMQDMMSYGASVGSAAARKEGAQGLHRQRHARDGPLVRRDSRCRHHAAFAHRLRRLDRARRRDVPRDFPDDNLTVLTDYFGREMTDGLAVCRAFPELAAAGRLSVRLDTHGGRFLEGLDPAESYAALERHAPGAIRRYRSDAELRYLVGTGVSAAAVWRMREALDEAGFPSVRIVASSGFGVDKCRVMADARRRSTWSEPAASSPKPGPRRTPRPISSSMTACRGEGRPRVPAASGPRAGSACVSDLFAPEGGWRVRILDLSAGAADNVVEEVGRVPDADASQRIRAPLCPRLRSTAAARRA